jgi:alkanesulfonate monooxygenase SsuD/methylene tetrahydromethanopterin reductase-like flavin-dependent oxidoreductase (luciferase family)
MCVVDQLTEGRLEFGVGRGPVPIEHYWFSHEWADARERFADVLGIVARALETGEISSQKSRFFAFPTMPMATRPFQENIPFWYPGSPQIAGRYGMSLMWPGKINQEAHEQYVQAWHDHQGEEIRLDGPNGNPRVGYSMLLAIAPTEDEALDIAPPRYEGPGAAHAQRASLRPSQAARGGVL